MWTWAMSNSASSPRMSFGARGLTGTPKGTCHGDPVDVHALVVLPAAGRGVRRSPGSRRERAPRALREQGPPEITHLGLDSSQPRRVAVRKAGRLSCGSACHASAPVLGRPWGRQGCRVMRGSASVPKRTVVAFTRIPTTKPLDRGHDGQGGRPGPPGGPCAGHRRRSGAGGRDFHDGPGLGSRRLDEAWASAAAPAWRGWSGSDTPIRDGRVGAPPTGDRVPQRCRPLDEAARRLASPAGRGACRRPAFV